MKKIFLLSLLLFIVSFSAHAGFEGRQYFTADFLGNVSAAASSRSIYIDGDELYATTLKNNINLWVMTSKSLPTNFLVSVGGHWKMGLSKADSANLETKIKTYTPDPAKIDSELKYYREKLGRLKRRSDSGTIDLSSRSMWGSGISSSQIENAVAEERERLIKEDKEYYARKLLHDSKTEVLDKLSNDPSFASTLDSIGALKITDPKTNEERGFVEVGIADPGPGNWPSLKIVADNKNGYPYISFRASTGEVIRNRATQVMDVELHPGPNEQGRGFTQAFTPGLVKSIGAGEDLPLLNLSTQPIFQPEKKTHVFVPGENHQHQRDVIRLNPRFQTK